MDPTQTLVHRYIASLLSQLQTSFPHVLGDVRGVGLFWGVECVLDRVSKMPAPLLAKAIKEGAKQRGVLLSNEGPVGHVIKFKPPMVFGKAEAELMVATMRCGNSSSSSSSTAAAAQQQQHSSSSTAQLRLLWTASSRLEAGCYGCYGRLEAGCQAVGRQQRSQIPSCLFRKRLLVAVFGHNMLSCCAAAGRQT
jgi:hypothetical protein